MLMLNLILRHICIGLVEVEGLAAKVRVCKPSWKPSSWTCPSFSLLEDIPRFFWPGTSRWMHRCDTEIILYFTVSSPNILHGLLCAVL